MNEEYNVVNEVTDVEVIDNGVTDVTDLAVTSDGKPSIGPGEVAIATLATAGAVAIAVGTGKLVKKGVKWVTDKWNNRKGKKKDEAEENPEAEETAEEETTADEAENAAEEKSEETDSKKKKK